MFNLNYLIVILCVERIYVWRRTSGCFFAQTVLSDIEILCQESMTLLILEMAAENGPDGVD